MVHQYKNNGYDIVLDVNSGAIHVVDDVTYDVIEMIDQSQPESYARDEIVSALSGKYLDRLHLFIPSLLDLIILVLDQSMHICMISAEPSMCQSQMRKQFVHLSTLQRQRVSSLQ